MNIFTFLIEIIVKMTSIMFHIVKFFLDNNIQTPTKPINTPINLPPIVIPEQTLINRDFISSPEYILSLTIVGFGLIIITMQVIIIRSKSFSDNLSMKFMILTLVIISSLFLITAGYDSKQVAPVTGLLGTIVGYLLGNSSENKDK